MNLGFKDRFVPMVEEGSKRHSIRAGARWKAGMRADLYARPRQKGMRLLFRAIVLKVEPITLYQRWVTEEPGNLDTTIKVRIDGVLLEPSEAEAFFRRDGFRDSERSAIEQAHGFWYGDLPFTGQLIHWDYENRFTDIADTCFHVSRFLAMRGSGA